MKIRFLLGSAVLAVLSFPALESPAQGQPEVSYKNDVVPIIHDYCLNCHEPGGKGYEKSGLDMRTYQSLMKGTKFGTVIKPGDSFTSILIQLVEGRAHASIKMPFGMSGGLAKDKIEILKKWVNQGAKNN
jgi:Planctomycete cytochrome C